MFRLVVAMLLLGLFFSTNAYEIIADAGYDVDEWPAYHYCFDLYKLHDSSSGTETVGVVTATQPNLHFIAAEYPTTSGAPLGPPTFRHLSLSSDLWTTPFSQPGRALSIGAVREEGTNTLRPALYSASYVSGDGVYVTMTDPESTALFGNARSIALSYNQPVIDGVADTRGNYFFSLYDNDGGTVLWLHMPEGEQWPTDESLHSLLSGGSIQVLYGGPENPSTDLEAYIEFLEVFENPTTGESYFGYIGDDQVLHYYKYRNSAGQYILDPARQSINLQVSDGGGGAYCFYNHTNGSTDECMILNSYRVTSTSPITRKFRMYSMNGTPSANWSDFVDENYPAVYSLTQTGINTVTVHNGEHHHTLSFHTGISGLEITIDSTPDPIGVKNERYPDNRLKVAKAIATDGPKFQLLPSYSIHGFMEHNRLDQYDESIQLFTSSGLALVDHFLPYYHSQIGAIYGSVTGPVGGGEIRCLDVHGPHLFYRGEGALFYTDTSLPNQISSGIPGIGYHAMTCWPGQVQPTLFVGGYSGPAWSKWIFTGSLQRQFGPFIPNDTDNPDLAPLMPRQRDFEYGLDEALNEIVLSGVSIQTILREPDIAAGAKERGQLTWFDPTSWTTAELTSLHGARFYTSASGDSGVEMTLDISQATLDKLAHGVQCIEPSPVAGEYFVGTEWFEPPSAPGESTSRLGDIYRVRIDGPDITSADRIFAGNTTLNSQVIDIAYNQEYLCWTDYQHLRILDLATGATLAIEQNAGALVDVIEYFGAVYPYRNGFVFTERVVPDHTDIGFVDFSGEVTILEDEQIPLGLASAKGRPGSTTAFEDGYLYLGTKNGVPEGSTTKSSFVYRVDLDRKTELHVGPAVECDYSDLDTALLHIQTNPPPLGDHWTILLHASEDPYNLSWVSFNQTEQVTLSILGVKGSVDEYESAASGSVRITGSQAGFYLNGCNLELQDLTFENVFVESGQALLNVLDSANIDNCQFLGTVGDLGVLKQHDGEVNIQNSVIAGSISGTEVTSWSAINVDGTMTIQNCTFHNNQSLTGDRFDLIVHDDDIVEITSCLFTHSGTEGTAAAIYNVDLRQPAWNTVIRHSLCDQHDWAVPWFDTTEPANNIVVPFSEAAVFVGYVDGDAALPDCRLRHDSQCLDKGDPAIEDFDLTASDIGYTAHYSVKQLPTSVSSLEVGWYEVDANTVINCPIPAGTTIRVGSNKTLFVFGDSDLQIGDASGPRTAIVGTTDPSADENALVIHIGQPGVDKSANLEGVLFNYPAKSGDDYKLKFRSLEDLNLNPSSVQFQNYGEAELEFWSCSGDVSGYSIRYKEGEPPEDFEAFPTPKQLTLLESGLEIYNCEFGVPTLGDANWTVKVQGAPLGANPVLWGNSFDYQGQVPPINLTSPVLVTTGILEMRDNQFIDCSVTALNLEFTSTVHMSDGAMNRFHGSDAPSFVQPLIEIIGDGYLDSYCGYNSFIIPGYLSGTPGFVSASSGTPHTNPRSWRRNFWGWSCTESIPTVDLIPGIPSWAELEYNLGTCPEFYSDICPHDESSALLTLKAGKDAELLGDLATAHGHFRAVVLGYPKDMEANEATLKLKALGLDKDYGELNFDSLQTDLFQSADTSLAYSVVHQAMLQECAAWCVEARWQRRSEILGILDSMLVKETDPINFNTIKLAKLEIQAYPPPPGGTSATSSAGMSQALTVQEIQAVHDLLHYEFVDTIPATVEDEPVLPSTFQIENVYPNPFNPSTTIVIDLPKQGPVQVLVYNLLGQEVTTLVSEELQAGSHKLRFDGSAYASGVYIIHAQSNQGAETRKMLLLK